MYLYKDSLGMIKLVIIIIMGKSGANNNAGYERVYLSIYQYHVSVQSKQIAFD